MVHYIDPLDGRYLHWLYQQVAPVTNRRKHDTFWELFLQLQETVFVAIVPHDDNRIADGKDLRDEFLAGDDGAGMRSGWAEAPCTMLELLIVLSRQLAFEMDDEVGTWFWHLIDILDLKNFNDHEYDEFAWDAIAEALDRVIWRTYEPDGRGGLFPLRDPKRDQRGVELWYQLNAYLLEQF